MTAHDCRQLSWGPVSASAMWIKPAIVRLKRARVNHVLGLFS